MEDSVGEEERREQGEMMAQPKVHQEEVVSVGGVGGGEPAQDGGLLSAMASKIGATMSGTNGSGVEANATAASDDEAVKRDGDGEPGEEGGGFLSAMASKIGAAMSGANGGSESDGGESGTAAAVASDDEGNEKDEGNGGGGIFHKLLSNSSPASSPASGALEAEEPKGEEKDQGVTDEHAGILSTMASKIGMAMSAANGNGNHGSEDATKTSDGHAVDGSNGEENGGDTNGGGILNAMASKIGMAMSGANGDEDHGGSGVNDKMGNGNAVDGSKDEEKRDETNGGGILSAVASKIGMTVSGANGNGNHSTEDGAKMSNGDTVHGSKSEEEKGNDANGAGIVEHIISNLPSDDQAPDSEEATLLIAIIED